MFYEFTLVILVIISILVVRFTISSSKPKCKHVNCVEIYRDYAEAYVIDECVECKKKIYSDI